jgi:hypothetical protein
VLEICDRVKASLGADVRCTIIPAPPDQLAADPQTASQARLQRR